jgi:hypothetical protein
VGDKGDQGPAGPVSVTDRHAASGAIANGATSMVTAKCVAGEKVIAGGGGWTYLLFNGKFFDDKSQLSVNAPSEGIFPLASEGNTPDGWTVAGTNTSGQDRTLRAYAVCAA